MAIQFESMLVAGTVLIREDIESQNYVTGVSGWAIFANGDAEFNNGIFRGQLTAGSITSGSIGDSTIINSTFNNGTINNSEIIFDDVDGGSLLAYGVTQASSLVTADGSFIVPAGVTSLKAEAWGGGGGGSGIAKTRPGGSGGEYAAELSLAVTPGESLTIDIGAGGTGGAANTGSGTNGAVTTIKRGATTLITANGGKGGTTGSTILGGTGSTNSTHFNGGNATCNNISLFPSDPGGGNGGGSSAGPSAPGNKGNPGSGTTGGTAGTGVVGGGNGGPGGAGTGANGIAGSSGSIPGGGGGSGGQGTSNNAAGGNGARGQVRLTWNTGQTLVASVAPSAGVDPFGTAYPQGLSALQVHAGFLQADNIVAGSFATGAMVVNSVTSLVVPYGKTLTGTTFLVFFTAITGTVGAGNNINEIGYTSASSTSVTVQLSTGSNGASRNVAFLAIGI